MPPSPRELAAQKIKIQRDQERLFQELLGILDALDHACEHWQQAEQTYTQAEPPPVPDTQPSLLQRWGDRLRAWWGRSPAPPTETAASESAPESTAEVVTSAREGVEMIQRSLLEVLKQRQVVPLEVMGQPFDPEHMHALGRQEYAEADENTVIQEVVRGYLWQNRMLREAQVMVAVKPSTTDD